MGSFWGHVDEAIFFLVISLWWMVNIFPAYVMVAGKSEELRFPFSFGLPGRREFPIEIIIKTGFPLFGFLAEVVSGDGGRFHDDDGNFINLVNLQHMSIYGIFVLHGVTDLFLWFGWPIVRNAQLLTVTMAFLWYAVAFFFHAQMPGKEPLEAIIHVVPIPILLVASLCGAVLMAQPEGISVRLAFTFCLLTLGTWFMHSPFILYRSDKFPGKEPSDWDRSDLRNVSFVIGIFGVHLCLNMVFMGVFYVIIYVAMTRLGWARPFSVPYQGETAQYEKLPLGELSY